MKLGVARSRANAAWRLVVIEVAEEEALFTYMLNRDKLHRARRREGLYLLCTNLTEQDPAKLLSYYVQLVVVKEDFKDLRGDVAAQSTPERGAH